MTLDFSRFIPAYRSLQRQLRETRALLLEAGSSRVRAEDEARLWRTKAEMYEQESREAREEERKAHHVMEDWLSMRITGQTVWGVAPPWPAKEPGAQPSTPPRRMARDVARELDKEFNAELEKRIRNIQQEAEATSVTQ